MAMPTAVFERYPGASLNCTVDLQYQDLLDSQNLASATITAIDSDLTIGTPSVATKSVSFRVSGGAAGRATLYMLATAADGQIWEQLIEVITHPRV